MKRGKKLLLLLLVLVIVLGMGLLVKQLTPEENDGLVAEGSTILAVDADHVSTITWEHLGNSFTLQKNSSQWVYGADQAFPLDQSYPQNILYAVADIRSGKTIDAPENLGEYGLDTPVCTVSFSDGTEFSLGNETGLGGQRYLSLGDDNVYLVDASLLDVFAADLYDMVEMESLPSLVNLQGLTIEAPQRTLPLEYHEDSNLAYSNDYVWFMKDGDNYRPLDIEAAEEFIELITYFSWDECVAYNADDAELASYGLTEPTVTVTFDYIQNALLDTGEVDEDGEAIYDSQTQNARFVLELGAYADDSCYARIQGSRMVYLIDGYLLDSLRSITYTDLRANDVCRLNWPEVTHFEVTMSGKTYQFTRQEELEIDSEGNVVEEVYYLLNDQEVAEYTVLSALNMISAMESTGVYGGSPDPTKELSFTFYRDVEQFAEMELIFYQHENGRSLVSFNGETRLLVSQPEVTAIAAAFGEIVGE